MTTREELVEAMRAAEPGTFLLVSGEKHIHRMCMFKTTFSHWVYADDVSGIPVSPQAWAEICLDDSLVFAFS